MITQALLNYLLDHPIKIKKTTPFDEIPSIISDKLIRFCQANKVGLRIYLHPYPWRIRVIRRINKVTGIREKTVRTAEEANEFLKEATLELNGTVRY